MRLEQTVRTLLESDAALSALLPGGIYDAEEMDRDNWTLQNVQRAPSGRLLPFAVLRWGGDVPGGGLNTSGRVTLDVWLYEDSGFSHIRPAMERARELLHLQSFNTDDKSVARGMWLGGLGEGVADELGKASRNRARIQFTYAWRT